MSDNCIALITIHDLSYRYPSYCGSNIWPHTALPELEVGMFIKDFYMLYLFIYFILTVEY